MRIAIALLGLILAAAPAPAGAREHAGGHARAGADSSRFLPRWLHAHIALGPGWLQSPKVIRSRYSPSFAGGFGLDVRPRPALDVAVEYRYLGLSPHESTLYGFYDPSGASPGVELSGGGYGHVMDLVLIGSVRPWSNWWLEAGAGGAQYSSGYPDFRFVDPVTGRIVDIPGKSGWGGSVLAGSRIEFQPTPRDRVFAEGVWTGTTVNGSMLGTIALRAGYRLP